MNFENLVDLPIEVTQPTMHVYGEGKIPGCSISCRAVVAEGTLTFPNEKGTTADMWTGDDEIPSVLAKLLNKKPWSTGEVQVGSCTIKDEVDEVVFETDAVNKITVREAFIKKGKTIEFAFSVSFRNDAKTLFAAQKLMKQEGLKISTDITETEEE